MKKVIIFLLIFFPIFKHAAAQPDSVNVPWGWKKTQQEVENLSEKMEKSYFAEVGGNEHNYPLTVSGLRDAISSLDSGIVYINYPGMWDTTGVGVVPEKVQVVGWLFGANNIAEDYKIHSNGPVFHTNTPLNVISFVGPKDSTFATYFGVLTGTTYGSYLNLVQNAEVSLTAWRTWDDNQGQLISGPSNFNGLNIGTSGPHDIIFSYNDWTEIARFRGTTGNLRLQNRLVQKVNNTNVSTPPTAAELNNAFPNAEEGEIIFIDDNNGSINFYQCIKEGTNWWIFTATKAM